MKKISCFFMAITLLSILFQSCSLFPVDIRYEVIGDCVTVSSITINNEYNETSKFVEPTLPWTYDFSCSSNFQPSITVDKNELSGAVTVSIYKNGKKVKSKTLSGDYGTIDLTINW